MTKIYHLCAMAQISDGSISYWDGILSSNEDMRKADDYHSIKKDISEKMKGVNDPTKVIITSMSVIG
jgi:hypothetical protein